MRTIKDIKFVRDIKILVRADFNVPIKDGAIQNDYRIRMALPTVKKLLENGAKVILMSHLEVKEGESDTLEPVAKRLCELGINTVFVKDLESVKFKIDELGSGACVLLENLRHNKGEKSNDSEFAKSLASLADIYVNEAFSVSHREHASVVGVPRYIDGYVGLNMENEISNLSKAFNPEKPFLFILGGAKFETKLGLLKKFIDIADKIFVGGALSSDILKARGINVGKSLVSGADIDLSAFVSNEKIILPIDITREDHKNIDVLAIQPEDMILDIGPKTLEILKGEISKSNFILWNGPMGLYEKGYIEGTQVLANTIANACSERMSKDALTTIVGGGDTLSAISKLGIEDKFTFVSTAGGAMLDFLANGTLPGIEALK
jgi:3-phosphoglycerate kinase